MGIIQRMTRLFKADIHGILDLLEEPDAALRQAVRDMEEEVERKSRSVQMLIQHEQQLESIHAEKCRALSQIDEKIDAAFSVGNEALARGFVRRKLEFQQSLKQSDKKLVALRFERHQLEKKLAEQKEQTETTRQKMQVFVETRSIGGNTQGDIHADMHGISEDEVEIAFLQERKQRENQQTTSRNADIVSA